MKKILKILIITLTLFTIKGTAQVSFTLTTSLPTCSTCCDGSFTVSVSGCTGYTVGTNPFIGIPAINGNNWIYTNVCSGNYTVTVLGNNPCTSAVQICNMNFSTVTSILKENLFEINFVIRPNPSNGIFYLEIDNTFLNQNNSIIITDINGKVVYNKLTISNLRNFEIDAKLEDGLYFLNIVNENKVVLHTQKIIINK